MRQRLVAALLGVIACAAPSATPTETPEAVQAPEVLYALPFDASTPRQLAQGVGGEALMPGRRRVGGRSHSGTSKYAFDFVMPAGSEVRAARAGRMEAPSPFGLSIRILHDDGTRALYGHATADSRFRGGEVVARGEAIGVTEPFDEGVPHLHFSVLELQEDDWVSIPIRFDDGRGRGFVPVTGGYYGESGN